MHLDKAQKYRMGKEEQAEGKSEENKKKKKKSDSEEIFFMSTDSETELERVEKLKGNNSSNTVSSQIAEKIKKQSDIISIASNQEVKSDAEESDSKGSQFLS